LGAQGPEVSKPNQNHVTTALVAFVVHSVKEFPAHTNVYYLKTEI
jgi:hypothetical protein